MRIKNKVPKGPRLLKYPIIFRSWTLNDKLLIVIIDCLYAQSICFTIIKYFANSDLWL
jgi:hypothetical protein